MATSTPSTRLALRPARERGAPDGAWWPESRVLGESLAELFALWPADVDRIGRVLYSPPDWDDRPRAVQVPGRRVKTGSFPRDDTRTLVVSMANDRRLRLVVIPPDTSADEAGRMMAEATGA